MILNSLKNVIYKNALLLVTLIFLWSCNNNSKNEIPPIYKKSNVNTKNTLKNISRYWKSVNNDIVKKIVVSKIDSDTYIFKTTCKDGGVKEYIILN